jgi:RNA polymerase primary sigma factor
MVVQVEELNQLAGAKKSGQDRMVAESADSLPLYFRMIGRVPLLRAETEVELAQLVERGAYAAESLRAARTLSDDEIESLHDEIEAGHNARERLIESNLRLVVSIARRYANRGLPLDDLIQAGNLGLLRAVKKYDYLLGYRFSTYATWWIRQSVTRAIADQARTVRIPAHLQDASRRAARYETQVLQSEGRLASLDELSRIAGVSAKRLREVDRMLPIPASLDLRVGDENDTPLADLVADPDAEMLEDLADRDLLANEMRCAFQELTDRERLVLGMRYGFNNQSEKSLADVGRELGVTRERVRQIEVEALSKLRQSEPNKRLRMYIN